MKNLFFVFAVFLCHTLVSQTSETIISTTTTGNVECVLVRQSWSGTKESTVLLQFRFQNKEYKEMTDSVYVSFDITNDKGPANVFLQDMKSAFAKMGDKVDLELSKGDYLIQLYDFTDDLYLYTYTPHKGKTTLTKEEVEGLLKWADEILLKTK